MYLVRSTNWGHYFLRLFRETGPPITWSSEPRECLAACNTYVVPSFLSYFKTLSIGPAPGIEPAISRSAVTRFTDWANTAAIKIK